MQGYATNLIMANPQDQASALMVQLMTIKIQEDALKTQKDQVKAELTALHEAGVIATTTDEDIVYSDGSTHRLRLNYKGTGSYFKVSEDFKDEWTSDRVKLENSYIQAGKAEMAEKAKTWVVQEVKAKKGAR